MLTKKTLLGLSIALFSIHFAIAQTDEQKENFNSFINRVMDNSTPIKIKKLELEAEAYRAKQTEYFYLPKLTATAKAKRQGDAINNQLTATALIYDSTLNHRFNEKDLKLKATELALTKEKEDLYITITNNLIGIHHLNELTKTTDDLNHKAQTIFSSINRRYQSGIAKLSDVEQATLLMQRIETEQKNIKTEIEQYKSNIELASGIPFPEGGVQVPNKLIKQLNSTYIDNQHTEQNIDFNILRMQADALKENAKQQDSLFNISLIAEERYLDKQRNHNESYAGVEVKVNVFDLDKKLSKIAQLKMYEATKGKADYKYKETTARIKNLKFISLSNETELTSLQAQLDTMRAIIISQEREYEISQSSFYEMVNTLFDMLTIERRIAELIISDMKNKMEYVQLTGKLAEIETSS
ncbi:TolC family protein [Providencia rettgeri]|uniref:TolC family protein n=1 Tax=Providencia rettgeri TaxID=587 RepID=UPI0034E07192